MGGEQSTDGAQQVAGGGAEGGRVFFDTFGPDCPWVASAMQGKTWSALTGRREKAPELATFKVRLEVRRVGGRGWSNVDPADHWKIAEVSLVARFGGGRLWRASIRWSGNTLMGSTVRVDLTTDPTPARAIPGDIYDIVTAMPSEENVKLRAELDRANARLASAEAVLRAPAPSPEVVRDLEAAARARDALQRENLRLWANITGVLARENELLREELDRVNARLAAMDAARAESDRAA